MDPLPLAFHAMMAMAPSVSSWTHEQCTEAKRSIEYLLGAVEGRDLLTAIEASRPVQLHCISNTMEHDEWLSETSVTIALRAGRTTVVVYAYFADSSEARDRGLIAKIRPFDSHADVWKYAWDPEGFDPDEFIAETRRDIEVIEGIVVTRTEGDEDLGWRNRDAEVNLASSAMGVRPSPAVIDEFVRVILASAMGHISASLPCSYNFDAAAAVRKILAWRN